MSFLNGIASAVASKLSLAPSQPEPSAPAHPLDPLSAAEIASAVSAIKQHVASQQQGKEHRVWFKSTQLVEPAKKTLAPYLEKWHAARASGEVVEPLPRRAEALLGVKLQNSVQWLEYIVDVTKEEGVVESSQPVPDSHNVPPDMEEMILAEQALLSHPEFKAAVAKLDLPSNATVVADGWIYGADKFEKSQRYISFMVYLSFSDDPDTCHYAAPLPLVPVIDAEDFTLVEIEYTPILGSGDKTLLDLGERFPWEKYTPNEYDAGIRQAAGLSTRGDLKPYRVVQPEGASFQLEGRVIRWQKWSLHIGFNYREGVVLSDVRYDGRPTFYRLSISDMTVPYGDPRSPYHRKQAFDLGDVGAGLTANELVLGCDCLGEILYLDWDHLSNSGAPVKMRGVVCIHEQDDGIGWKHTNFRTNKPSVTRSRVLIIQTIITVANYEYIFAWKLDQAAGLHLETRATGILSTCAILPGEVSPYGNVVSPGVLATNHQHLFCLRIDPSIDGHQNTVVQEDSVPMPFDKANPPADNRWGVGYVVEKKPLTVSGFADAAPHKNRVFKITNPSKLNPVSGRPVSYKLVPTPSQLLLAHPDSVAFARTEFGDHHIYVTQHRDGELYAGGRYTNQSYGKAEGIRSWIAQEDNIENDDIVVWHTFGLTHNPRVEDFPVPNDFFSVSPAIDVPGSTQAFNQSKLFSNATTPSGVLQGNANVEAEAKANGLGSSCCSK
ncbi:hypothetical protein EHS25_004711 [Saitozyma podzolica]|uniref:Amine oxidase n=1 Tax=Saitozyma podzolica TaxID=1890683 RepID=A0A427YV74_9TREE|nr:hypothetical protein EHS25_004711 [Saitozyma podzolica]